MSNQKFYNILQPMEGYVPVYGITTNAEQYISIADELPVQKKSYIPEVFERPPHMYYHIPIEESSYNSPSLLPNVNNTEMLLTQLVKNTSPPSQKEGAEHIRQTGAHQSSALKPVEVDPQYSSYTRLGNKIASQDEMLKSMKDMKDKAVIFNKNLTK